MPSSYKSFMLGASVGIAFTLCVVTLSLKAMRRSSTDSPMSGTVACYFSPRGGATEALVKEIDAAKSDVLVQAFSFTSKPITDALIRAHRRSVRVVAVIDSDQYSAVYTDSDDLHAAGVPVYFDKKHAIAHNKIMLIDCRVIATGSFNFTKAGEERNAENLLVITGNDDLMKKYGDNFRTHLNHAIPYTEMAASKRR